MYSPRSVKLNGSSEACIKFAEFVDKTPLAKAILRHISTVPLREKRFQLLSKWKVEEMMVILF